MKSFFHRKKFWISVGSLAIVSVFGVFGWFLFLQRNVHFPEGVYIGEQLYTLEYALTKEEQSRGLGGRESLCQTCAMAFPFIVPGRPAFWMEGMRFPIDIMWVSSDGSVVDIARRISPDSRELYQPEELATLVLEFNAGILDSVMVGEKLRFFIPIPMSL
jgi:uncharacterized membrane protein (UPF0127 family)